MLWQEGGETPLHHAASFGPGDVCELLIGGGVDVAALDKVPRQLQRADALIPIRIL